MAVVLRKLFFVSVALWAGKSLLEHRRKRRERRHAEGMLDETIEDSFPASDPPATQDFDIPENRR